MKHRVAYIGWFNSVKGARASMPPNCELVGLCDIRADLIDRCRHEDPAMFCTTDFHEIAKMDNCDTVLTCTPNATHRDIAVACLRGGKHVFIEKPMGCNLDEARDILRAEKESGKFVGVDLEFRFARMTGQETRRIIDSGEIGKVLQVEVEHHRGGWLCTSPSNTYRTKKATSGMMKMEGIHSLDLFRFWAGEVTAVQSFSAPNALTHYEFPDNITIILWFANGAMGRYTSSHTKCSYELPNNAAGPKMGHVMKWYIVGTKGSISIDLWDSRLNVYHFVADPPGTNSLKPMIDRSLDFSGFADPTFAAHDMEGCRQEFLRRMAAGLPPYQAASDAFRSEQIAWASEESCYNGAVKIDCTNL